MTLTDSYATHPASSVCGPYFSHPESRYFSVGKIGDDQLANLADRKQLPKSALAPLARAYYRLTGQLSKPTGSLTTLPVTAGEQTGAVEDSHEVRQNSRAESLDNEPGHHRDRGRSCLLSKAFWLPPQYTKLKNRARDFSEGRSPTVHHCGAIVLPAFRDHPGRWCGLPPAKRRFGAQAGIPPSHTTTQVTTTDTMITAASPSAAIG